MSDNRRTTGQNENVRRPSQAANPSSRPAGSRPQSTAPRQGYPSQRPPVRRRKKKRATGRFVAFIVVLALLIVGIVVLVPKLRGNEEDRLVNNNDIVETPAPANKQNEQPNENIAAQTNNTQTTPTYKITTLDESKMEPNESLDGTWRSVLLIGTDARLWDDMKHSDTMIIVCYNTQNGAVRMISVMRDAFVNIPEQGNVRINTVSATVNMEALIRTLNQNLGLNIREYMCVDFEGFRNVIDILGGIDVDITEVEMEYINSGLKEQVNLIVHKSQRESTLAESTLTTYGPNTHLNGLQALAYARIRKSDSDYKRTERQRTVVMKAAQKAIDTVSIVQMKQIASTMLQYVETNMQLTSLVQLGLQVVQRGLSDMEEMRVPVNGTYTEETRGSTWGMYDVDWAANKREVERILFGY